MRRIVVLSGLLLTLVACATTDAPEVSAPPATPATNFAAFANATSDTTEFGPAPATTVSRTVVYTPTNAAIIPSVAPVVAPPMTSQAVASSASVLPSPPSLKAARVETASPKSTAIDPKKTPQQSLTDANRAARQGPKEASFEEATLFYAWEPGAIYELHTAPSYISTILLESGESLIDVAAGDTSKWMVSHTVSGTGEAARTLIIVKPLAPKLKTNIVLVTDKRAYLIEAVSAAGDTYSAQIAWRYPKPPAPPVIVPPSPPPRLINTSYAIKPPKKNPPVWTPVRVWDDGFKTHIEFAPAIQSSDMPPLFVRTGEGLELVNYRVESNAYVVDQLFDQAELRLGRLKPQVVRIERAERNPTAITAKTP